MRPDEYLRQCAMDWTEAVTLRNAIHDGESVVSGEKQAMEAVNRQRGGH